MVFEHLSSLVTIATTDTVAMVHAVTQWEVVYNVSWPQSKEKTSDISSLNKVVLEHCCSLVTIATISSDHYVTCEGAVYVMIHGHISAYQVKKMTFNWTKVKKNEIWAAVLLSYHSNQPYFPSHHYVSWSYSVIVLYIWWFVAPKCITSEKCNILLAKTPKNGVQSLLCPSYHSNQCCFPSHNYRSWWYSTMLFVRRWFMFTWCIKLKKGPHLV